MKCVKVLVPITTGKKTMKTARQLVDYIGIEQTDEEWQSMVEMTQEELLYSLTRFAQDNFLKVFNPN